ncbi:15729_t:CDS:2, partial [Entrophospora sp. SA101]
MFHPDYNPIISKLPKSLVKRVYHRLLYRSRLPITPELISEKCDRIEAYLYHTLEVYEKGLNRKRKKQIQTIELLENLSYNSKASVKTYIDMTNQETQTQNINPICTCNHEEEINRRVKKELDILCRRLLEYNEETFGKFMREIIIEHVDRVKANKKLRCKVEEKKIELQEAEKYLEYLKSRSKIQSFKEELERLENASEGEKAELRLEISSLKRSLYQTKKEIRDKVSYTDIIEKQLQESEERVQNLRHRFKVISSRRSSPNLYNSEEEDIDMAHIDPFINITRGLNRLENHFTGGTPLNNPANIIQGMYGTLNTIRANYQRIDQDLDDVTNQRDARDAQIVQLQQDVNYFRQQNIALQNHVNQLTLERNNSQNDLALMTTAYYNEREERRHWWR